MSEVAQKIIDFQNRFVKEEVQVYQKSTISNPKVTVVINTYNQQNFIEQTINSVLEQETNFEFEIIIIDDESNDDTFQIAKTLADQNPKIITLCQNSRKNNIIVDGKPTGRFSFFWGVLQARGTLIAWLDGDDYWCDKNKLQVQVNFLEKNKDVDLVSTRFYKKEGKAELQEDLFGVLFRNSESPVYFTTQNFFDRFYIRPSTVMYRNPNGIGWFLSYNYLRANTIFYELLKNGNGKGVLLPDFTTVYRIHKSGVYSGLDVIEKKYITYITKFEVYKNNKGQFRNSDFHNQLKGETRYFIKSFAKRGKLRKVLKNVKNYIDLF